MQLTREQKEELFARNQEMIKAYTLKCMKSLCVPYDLFDDCYQEACVTYLEQLDRSESDEWFDHLDYLSLRHRICVLQLERKRISMGKMTINFAEKIRNAPIVYSLDIETDRIIETNVPLNKASCDDVERSAIIDDVFRHMTEFEREVINYRLKGLKMCEIAEKMGVCTATITNTLARLNKRCLIEEG